MNQIIFMTLKEWLEQELKDKLVKFEMLDNLLIVAVKKDTNMFNVNIEMKKLGWFLIEVICDNDVKYYYYV